MIAAITSSLQKSYKDYWPYEINQALGEMFHKKAKKECYEVIKALLPCKLKEGECRDM